MDPPRLQLQCKKSNALQNFNFASLNVFPLLGYAVMLKDILYGMIYAQAMWKDGMGQPWTALALELQHHPALGKDTLPF